MHWYILISDSYIDKELSVSGVPELDRLMLEMIIGGVLFSQYPVKFFSSCPVTNIFVNLAYLLSGSYWPMWDLRQERSWRAGEMSRGPVWLGQAAVERALGKGKDRV